MRNSEVAEDLTQETMLAVHAALDKGQQLRLIENFAFRVGFRVQYGYFRRAYRETPTISFEDLQYEPTSSQPGEEMASSDNSQYIQRLMEVIREKLSGAEQHVLALYYQGETQKSIAATLDMPVGTIGSHLSRGRGRLLAHLVEDDPELLGGMNIINQAWSDALTDTPPPTEAEIAAWAKRKPVEHFRAACLKMAKHLPSPLTDVSK
jgi:RNA polymerase sigma factor (sigma-70 family)